MWDCPQCACQAIAADLGSCPQCFAPKEEDVPKTTASGGGSNVAGADAAAGAAAVEVTGAPKEARKGG